MPNRNAQLPALWVKTRSAFLRLATGGDWAINQTAATRRNLAWFWLDGLFASAGDNIIVTYLVVYLLALGATQAQIGMLSSFSSLSAALMLLPGAMLVERIGRRRNISLAAGGVSRLALVLLTLLPFFAPAAVVVPIAMLLSVTRDAMNNLGFPAWIALTGDIVPIEGRGRYFSSRNFVMGLAGMLVTLLAGLAINRFTGTLGYQVVLLAAFAIGLLSFFSFAQLTDPPRPLPYPRVKQPAKLAAAALFRELGNNPDFLGFAATSALWNLSLNIAGPFFSVYLVQNLHADATMIAVTSVASTVASILVQRKAGELNDRWGARRLTMVCGLLIPIVPLLWVFAGADWHIILINLLSGAVWAGYSLASFNYLLLVAPEDRRARYSALFQMIVTLSLAAGAALGSLVIVRWGYLAVFSISAGGRLLAALLFALLRKREKPSAGIVVAAEETS